MLQQPGGFYDYFKLANILAVKKAGHLNIKTKMASEYSQSIR